MKNDTHSIPSYSYPYKVIDGCLYREKIDKYGAHDQKLCNFLPYIVSEVTLDNGVEESKQLRLGGFRCDGSPLPEIEVSGSELGSFNWLIDKWGADCILEIGQSVHDSVRYAIQLTAKDAEHQTIYEVTGWKKIGGVWSFLLPGDADHTVRLPGKLSRYALPGETLPEALPVLAELIGHPPAPREVIWPLLAYTFLSPLNHFLHEVDCEPKFLILFLGRTGTGKSTLSSLFLSFFGHFTPSDLPISFRDTKNSINQCCAMLNDVLTCVDDFHPSGRKEEQELMEKAQMLARAYGDRVGRGRLRADSTLMPTRPVRGNAILTAEFPPEIGESGLARCFTVELRFGDLDMESYRFFEAESRRGVFQSCMLVFTQWLREKFLSDEKTEELFVTQLREIFETYRDDFRARVIRCHGRLPEIVAWLRMGLQILLLFLLDQQILTQKQVDAYRADYISLLYTMAQKQAQNIEQDKPAHIFLRKLFSLIESEQVSVLPKNKPFSFSAKNLVAYEDDEFYYLLNDAAHQAVKKLCEDQGELFAIGSRSLPKALADENLIDCGDGENTKSIRVGTATKRVVALYKERARKIVETGMA